MTQDRTTQDPATGTPGRKAPASPAPDAGRLGVDDLAQAVALAEKLRRRFELDPRGYVEPQVEARLRQLHYQGHLRTPRQENQARLFFAQYYQEQGGIESPRLLSNQERAELVEDFLRADLGTRVDLMKDLETVFSDDWQKAFGELIDGLPLRDQPVARRTYERFEHHRLHSVDPAVGLSIDDWSGELNEATARAAYPDARNFGAGAPAPKPEPDPGTAGHGEGPPVQDFTDDWSGPALGAARSAFLAGVVDDILAAAPEDLPVLEARIEAAFADDPATVQRLVSLARARLGGGSAFLVPVGESPVQVAEAALRDQRDRLLAGRDYNDQRREDRAAFAALEAASGLRLSLRDDGRIAIGEPERSPFVVVSWPVAGALARSPEEARARFALLNRLITSPEPDHALRNEVDRALGLIAVDEGGEPADFEATRQAILAARAAIRAGHDPAAVRAGLIATFFPEVTRDSIAWGELLLDLLPVIGEIRSAADAVESFDAMAAALARGDLEEAAKQGLLGALATAGAVPAVGPLFKTLRTLTVRALRTPAGTALARETPGLNRGVAHVALTRRLDRNATPRLKKLASSVRSAKAEDVFASAWPALTADKKKLLRGLLPHIKGRSVEGDFEELLKILGVQLAKGQRDRTVPLPSGDRILDAVAETGFSRPFRTLTELFFLPAFAIKPGTGVEMKQALAVGKPSQRAKDRQMTGLIGQGQPPSTLANITIEDYLLLRAALHEVPETRVLEVTGQLLEKHVVQTGRLTRADADDLLRDLRTWHRDQARGTAGEVATLGEAVLALGLAASARAAQNAIGSGADASEPEK